MKPIRKFHKFLTNQKFLFRMSSNSQSESNLPKALAADLKKFDKAELQKTKTEEKVLTPSLAAAGKPIKSKFFRRFVFEPDQKFEPNIFVRFVFSKLRSSQNKSDSSLRATTLWESFEESWHQNADSGEKWLLTPTEILTTSGVLMSGFFEGPTL